MKLEKEIYDIFILCRRNNALYARIFKMSNLEGNIRKQTQYKRYQKEWANITVKGSNYIHPLKTEYNFTLYMKLSQKKELRFKIYVVF